jgi:hypothetical protein
MNDQLGNCASTSPIIHEINVDTCPFFVSENLYDALCNLSAIGITGFIWVDAICIDQNNLHERSSQVLLMGDIYANAQGVIVWLGTDAADLDDFLWLHRDFFRFLDLLEDWDPPTPFDLDMLRSLGVSLRRRLEYWQSYGRFYRRHRWFSRAWVFQEAALARKITVHGARMTLNWEDMERLSDMFIYMPSWMELVYLRGRKRTTSGLDWIPKICITASTVRNGGAFDTGLTRDNEGSFIAQTPEEHWYSYVMFLLNQVRDSEASDLHDKIYGVLGIANRFLPAGTANGITPDYSKSVEGLYTSVSLLLLKKLPTLAILSYLDDQDSRNFPSLPSWCPDFSRPLSQLPLIAMCGSDDYKLFNASRLSWEALHKAGPPCQVLNLTPSLTGKRLDTIEEIYHDDDILQLFGIALGLDHLYHLTNQHRMEVLWRTMIADISMYDAIKQAHPAELISVEIFIR